jgi:hypothetical protein
MPDNVFIQLPLVIQDLYLSVNDLPVGPASNQAPRSSAQGHAESQDTHTTVQR